MLVLGASGGVLGTRYLVTTECIYTPNMKEAVLAATHSVRSFVFDELRKFPWPPGVDGRGLYNKTLEDAANGVDFEEQQKRFAEGVKNKDTSRIAVWSGASVGLVNEAGGAEVCI